MTRFLYPLALQSAPLSLIELGSYDELKFYKHMEIIDRYVVDILITRYSYDKTLL